MSIHLNAKQDDIAKTVLLPGDPLRAKFIAETFLENYKCYSTVRGMYGYTGTYKGKKISVQGTGMGIPSISIYVNELINDYGVKNLIRVGTAGSLKKDVKVRDLVIAMSACTDSNINKIRFNGRDFAPTASFNLLKGLYESAENNSITPHVGSVFTSDTFYQDNQDNWKLWAKFGCLAVEMETAGLYTLAAKYEVNAISVLTVSDHMVTGELTTAEERQTTFTNMIKISLDAAINF